MTKYKIPKSFGSYIAQLKDDECGIHFIVWSKFMWMCNVDSIQPHTLTTLDHVNDNLQRFYGKQYHQFRKLVCDLGVAHGIALVQQEDKSPFSDLFDTFFGGGIGEEF